MAIGRMRGETRGERARALGALILVALSGFAPAAAAAEKVFTYALAAAPESLDSAKTTSERAWYVTWLLCDALVNVSADGRRLEPSLAESWTLAADGLSATIRLRAGARKPGMRVEVSDGDPRVPHMGDPTPDRVGSRGLPIVAAVAAEWGWDSEADERGKRVWFTRPTQDDAPAGA